MVSTNGFDCIEITSPECHVDIFVDFTTDSFNLLCFQCKYLHFPSDTVDLSIDGIIYFKFAQYLKLKLRLLRCTSTDISYRQTDRLTDRLTLHVSHIVDRQTD